MRLKRHGVEVFSLSFLDCICCGFGAIILLLVLTEYGDPIQLQERTATLKAQVNALQQQLHEIRGETELLNSELRGKIDLLQKERMRAAQLAGDLTNVSGKFAASKKEASVTNIVEGELVAAYQTLTEEMKRLLKDQASRPKSEAIGGIPIDSEYIIFIVDTSASMTSFHWPEAQAIVKEILSIYPKVKGLQIMSDQGSVLIGGTRGKWLTDSTAQREQIVNRMKTWRAFSKSSPVEGIETAIRLYWAPDKRISLYVVGDEFTGDSIQAALDAVAAVNKPDKNGRRLVRIHAIGFPEGPGMTPFTSIRFSALMRLMCEQNNGTFVGVTQ
ncbi:MAG: VWA domain-containing protein [Steroidobacteraceae bacterium]|nr:VWA domain-containing protein [Steroidobacteraceae bacterium]